MSAVSSWLVLAVGLAQNASAKGPPNAEVRTLEGTWWVQSRLLPTACPTPLMSFTVLLTFAKGGTMTGTTTNPAFAIGQRSPDHGGGSGTARLTRIEPRAWHYSSGRRQTFPPPVPGRLPPAQPAIDVTDPDHFTSDAVSEFFDVGGNSDRASCDRCRAAVRIVFEPVSSRQFNNGQFIVERVENDKSDANRRFSS